MLELLIDIWRFGRQNDRAGTCIDYPHTLLSHGKVPRQEPFDTFAGVWSIPVNQDIIGIAVEWKQLGVGVCLPGSKDEGSEAVHLGDAA
jgi:hypothetical protein